MRGVALALLGFAIAVATAGESASGVQSPCSRTVVAGAAFSADSKWVGVARQRSCDALSSLLVLRTDGRGRRTLGRTILDWGWAPRGDRLALEPIQSGLSSLVVTTTAGKRVLRVADATAFAWSPNGRELAVRRRDPEDIVVAPVSGATRPVAEAPRGNFLSGQALEWAPDGRSILFTAAGDGPRLSIRAVGEDGTGEHELARGADARWSPEGSRVVYGRPLTGRGGYEWETARADGSDPRSVGPECGSSADWAPQGEWLSFASCTSPCLDCDPVASVAPADGASLLSIGSGVGYWSPRGNRLALVASHRGVAVTLVDPDGSRRVSLPFADRPSASWSPSGGAIVVTGRGRLYRVKSDGGGKKLIAVGDQPVWSPNGRWIAFVRHRSCGDDLYALRLSPRKLRRLIRCS